MQLSKVKTIAGISTALLLVIAIIWIFSRINRSNNSNLTGFEAIPVNAAFIIQSDDLSKMFNYLIESHVWIDISVLPGLYEVNNNLRKLDSLSTSNNQLENFIDECQLKISAHALGKHKPEFLYTLLFPNQIPDNRIHDYVKQLFFDTIPEESSRKYEGHTLYDLKHPDKAKNSVGMSFTIHQNMLLFSSSAILLENAIRQLKLETDISDDPAFEDLISTAGKNVPANLLVNHSELPNFFSLYSRNITSANKSFLKNFSDWSVLDLKIKDDVLLFSGFTNQKDTLGQYLSVFFDQNPGELHIPAIAPANTRTYLSIGFKDADVFSKKYTKYLSIHGQVSSHEVLKQAFQERTGINIQKDVLPLIDREIGLIYTSFAQQSLEENIFSVIRSKSIVSFEEIIRDAIVKVASAKGENAAQYTSKLSIDQTARYDIYHLPKNHLLNAVFGNIFQNIDNDYITFIDDFVIFAHSRSALNKYIHFYVLGKTLESDLQYQNLAQYFSTQANLTLYSNIPNSIDIYSRFLSSELVHTIRSRDEVFSKVRGLGLQYHNSGDYVFNTFYVKYLDKFTESAHTVWETLLDTTVWFKPTFVKNHYTNENEIFIQDEAYNVYLINKIGRVLWKITLDEPILGDVYQVDYYKNNKLQLMFSTASKIHLIDRNGNYVERYPINLREKASAGMALFDYEQDKNYRIFIPTVDRNVYLYNLEGNLIEGWDFDKTEHIVTSPLQHFRIGDKDYIVCSDKYRAYILNRRGEIRVPVDRIIPFSKNNTFFLDDERNGNARMAITDTSGTVYFFYFDGTIEQKSFGTYSAGHHFLYEDISGDKQRDIIFLDGGVLRVFNQKGKELFTYKLDEPADFAPIFFDFGLTDRKIGLVENTTNLIYLINNDGSLYEDFPLRGTTPFSIGRLTESSRFNLIVGNSDNFLFNYSVQ